MKKTSSRIMAIALTVAILASLVVGILPVGALTFSTPNVSLSNSLLSTTATYTVNAQTSSFGFIATPAGTADTNAGPTISIPANTRVFFATTGTLTISNGAADAGALYNNGALPIVAGVNAPITILAAGDSIYFNVAQSNMTLSGGASIYHPVSLVGSTAALAVVVGQTIVIVSGGSIYFPAADPAVAINGGAPAAVAAGSFVAVAAGNTVTFGAAQTVSFFATFNGGVLVNGTGTATGAPITLVNGANTITTTVAGTFTLNLPAGVTATVAAGTVTTAGYAAPTITTTGTGTFTVTLSGGATATTYTPAAYRTISVSANDFVVFTAVGTSFYPKTSDPSVTKETVAGVVTVPGVTAGIATVAGVNDVFQFLLANTLVPTADGFSSTKTSGSVTVQFPAGTTLPASIRGVMLNINNAAGSTATIVAPAKVNTTTLEVTVYALIPNETNQASTVSGVGNLQVVIPGVINPGTPASTYSVNIKTSGSGDTTYITSTTYTIAAAPPPPNINVYNAGGFFLGQFTSFGDAGLAALMADGITLKLDPATYLLSANFTVTNANVQIMPSTGSNADTIIADDPAAGGTAGIVLNGTGDVINNLKFTTAPLTLGGANETASNLVVAGGITVTGSNDTISGVTATSTVSISYAGVPTYGGFTVSNSTFDITSGATGAPTTSLILGAGITTGTISGNTFKFNQSATTLAADTALVINNAAVNGVNITNNTFTGSTGGRAISVTAAAGTVAPISISKNTFTSAESAIVVSAAAVINIQNNTIDKSITNYNGTTITTWVGAVEVSGGPTMNLNGNIISNSAGYSIDIASGSANNIMVTGNNFRANAKGLNNNGTGILSAVQNWWGDATGPKNAVLNPAGVGDAIGGTGTTLFTPFLAVVPSAGGVLTITTGVLPTTLNPDFSATSGVAISGFSAAALTSYTFATQRLTGNPKPGFTPPFPALTGGYFDVYIPVAPTGGTFQIKFYVSGITNATQVYYWSTVSNSWTLCSDEGVAGTGDFAYVNVTATGSPNFASLNGTAFAVVMGTAPTPAPFAITAPTIGANQPLTNISFTWASVANVTSYEFILANNSAFATPFTVDQKALSLPVYQYTGANLVAGTTYFWRVIAYQGNTVIANSQIGYFTAAGATTTGPATTTTVTSTTSVTAPPVTTTLTVTPTVITTTNITIPPAVTTVLPTPTIVITTNPPATITFTNPTPVVTTYTLPAPSVTEVTPAWIWGVIGIGAILIIVVIVLIVRTRRSV